MDRSIVDPGIFLKTNILGTQVLMDACRKYGVKRFHQVSTDEVYGDLPLDRPDLLFTEESPLRPSSPYSASKAGADLLTLAYCRTYGLPVTVSRCSNNYGPYQFPEKLIPRMIVRALAGKTLPVYGGGENVRDWLHVDDHCAALDAILQRGVAGEVYNIGGRSERTNLEIVGLICHRLDVPPEQVVHVADPGRATTSATPSTAESCPPSWAGSLRCPLIMGWMRPSTGIWTTAIGGSHARMYEKELPDKKFLAIDNKSFCAKMQKI